MMPITTTSPAMTTKKYVGNANALPASRTPRRLPKASTSTTTTVMLELLTDAATGRAR